jgi:guanylate kinase
MRDDVVRVFLLPPSLAELRRRLTGRGTDSADVIDERMARAQSEISHWDGYDYVVINDDIQACFEKVSQILEAERQRRTRQTGLITFVSELMKPEG